jgi:8-oxo-dGTP pyrophosphatase MutT (NUDIX family)
MNKKLSEEILVKTPVFNVVSKKFENQSFSPVGLNCNDWVMICVKDTKNDRWLLVEQTRWGIEGKTIEFPCGTVESSEVERYGRSFARFVAAERELKEETGLKLNDDVHLLELATFNPNPAYFNNTMTIFYVEVPDLEYKVSFDASDLTLDKDEDCKPFLTSSGDYDPLYEVRKSGLGLAAYGLLSARNYL